LIWHSGAQGHWRHQNVVQDAFTRLLHVNPGEIAGQPALPGFHGRQLAGVLVFSLRGETIQAVHVIADLAKLSYLNTQLIGSA
jgi:hypothetical protein